MGSDAERSRLERRRSVGVYLPQGVLPQPDHLARLGGQVGARQEGSLGRSSGGDEQVEAGLWLAAQQRAHERHVELPLLLGQRRQAVNAL
jgi:hypothetical protein